MKIFRYVAIISVFVLLGVLLIHSLNSINQDIGRHLKSGQIIWETKSVYKTNLFSFTEPGTPFINHHWLSEVFFYLLNGFVGLKGLILLKVGLVLLAFMLVVRAVFRKTGMWPILISLTIGIFVFTHRTDIRPEIFSYLFLSFFIFAIFKSKYTENNKWLYFLPLIQVFWTNMHIYFALGPMLLFLFLIDRLIHREAPDFLRKFFYIFIATSLATLVNPNFIKGALLPLNILKNYGYRIVENQSIFFLKDYGILLTSINFFEISLVILLISFIVAIRNGARKITFEILAAIVFSILGMNMIRNFGIYSLIFIPIVALNLSYWQSPKWLNKKFIKTAGYVIFTILMMFLAISIVNNNYYKWIGSPKKFGLIIPAGAESGVKFVKENGITGPVFNNFDIGSFLIWKMYPEQKVFVDGRPEAYTVDFFEKIYKPMQEDPVLWDKYSEQYDINYIFWNHHDITPWSQKFLNHISQNQNWPLVYLDNSTAIFLKKNPSNEELIKKTSNTKY